MPQNLQRSEYVNQYLSCPHPRLPNLKIIGLSEFLIFRSLISRNWKRTLKLNLISRVAARANRIIQRCAERLGDTMAKLGDHLQHVKTLRMWKVDQYGNSEFFAAPKSILNQANVASLIAFWISLSATDDANTLPPKARFIFETRPQQNELAW